eukprot:TRINITY_DN17579_c0_g1_i1.p1 TRINITY_DN17579_c0_g1~~TRINITY_DN17579_c0_g1_i1.p1  ORF type:complete len:643 (+),score=127.56 TRINITY_DN17579_c0_g1_i1:65-1930(+)
MVRTLPDDLSSAVSKASMVPHVESKVPIMGGKTVAKNKDKHKRGWDNMQDLNESVAKTCLEAKEVWKHNVYNEDPCEDILAKCVETETRFKDPSFEPSDKSLWGSQREQDFPVKSWKRASDLFWEPSLFKDGVNPDDVQQGGLGDCWLLSAVSALSKHTDLTSIFHPPCFNPYGVYSVRFIIDNKERYVVVDDYVPADQYERPSFSHSENGEIWVMILEKAYAKLHGNYQVLDGGVAAKDGERSATAESLFNDLSGGYSKYTPWKEGETADEQFTSICDVLSREGCCTISCGESNEDEKTQLGLVTWHEYSIIDFHHDESDRFVRIRNPWGSTEWKGRYSDNHSSWESRPDLKEKLVTSRDDKCKDDGAFWMEWSDCEKYFESVYLCHNIMEGFEYQGIKSAWTEATAGGHSGPGYNTNPRFHLEISQPMRCFFELKPPDARFSSENHPYMMINVFKAPDDLSAPLRRSNAIVKSPLMKSIGKWEEMEAGSYLVVVATQKKDELSEFFFRFCSVANAFTLRDITAAPQHNVTKILQDLLDMTGKPISSLDCALKTAFDAIDADGSGGISLREFKASYDALENFGLQTDAGADTLFKQYDSNKDGKLSFDEFALVMTRRMRS